MTRKLMGMGIVAAYILFAQAALTPGDRELLADIVAPTVVGVPPAAARTSGPHHVFCSSDGGETWSAPVESEAFWAANTMPLFFRLKNDLLLFIWNNTAMLPTRPLASSPRFGLSYLHLQTLAETTDPKGTFFRSFTKVDESSTKATEQ